MTTNSVLPAWELQQLTRLYQHRPEMVRAALRRLLAEDTDLRWSVVVGAYLDRQVNLGKAADLLGMHETELRDRFVELGIPLRFGPTDVDDARAEVETVRRWFVPPSEDTDATK